MTLQCTDASVSIAIYGTVGQKLSDEMRQWFTNHLIKWTTSRCVTISLAYQKYWCNTGIPVLVQYWCNTGIPILPYMATCHWQVFHLEQKLSDEMRWRFMNHVCNDIIQNAI